jgi:hypothetical protein
MPPNSLLSALLLFIGQAIDSKPDPVCKLRQNAEGLLVPAVHIDAELWP